MFHKHDVDDSNGLDRKELLALLVEMERDPVFIEVVEMIQEGVPNKCGDDVDDESSSGDESSTYSGQYLYVTKSINLPLFKQTYWREQAAMMMIAQMIWIRTVWRRSRTAERGRRARLRAAMTMSSKV